MNSKRILIIADHEDGQLNDSVFDLLSLALTLTDKDRTSLSLVLLGHDLDALAATSALQTGVDVLAVSHEALVLYNGEVYATLLESIIRDLNPSHVLSAHTSQGMDYAPGLAVRLNAGCITSVNGLTGDDKGNVLFSRAICGGNFNAGLTSRSALTVLTVQPGSFKGEDYSGPSGQVHILDMAVAPQSIQSLGLEKSGASASRLHDAKIIVSAGRGIGEEDNLEAIRRFAALLPGSAVGGSRPLIDIGWLEYKYQVGITGAVVSPEVYIACGISGSTQHIAGMNTAKFVISINTDRNAAIFNVSDVCIVDDVIDFIETVESLIEED